MRYATFTILSVIKETLQQLVNTQHTEGDQKQLLEACRKGKPEAFKKLYEMYSAAMFSICIRMLNHTAEAEDVLQESFISAFKNIHNFPFVSY